ncbi:hypothetical protein Ocin01_08655 [Orchesella cincta]|uniref:Uncharacterized protein n=1 Tax=Orchesella cincta TaxID=48709 RepID=A0A1D2MY97_ORCCI|nr:hypothetical protein Ocin01_08655 [Orchesella cincta]
MSIQRRCCWKQKANCRVTLPGWSESFHKNLHGERCIDLVAKNIQDGSKELKLYVKSLLNQFIKRNTTEASNSWTMHWNILTGSVSRSSIVVMTKSKISVVYLCFDLSPPYLVIGHVAVVSIRTFVSNNGSGQHYS